MKERIHIKYVKTHDRVITRKICPDCGRYSYFLNFYEEWYGWDTTCLNCGRRWSDGWKMPLAFSKFARQKNIDAAKRRWRRGLDEKNT